MYVCPSNELLKIEHSCKKAHILGWILIKMKSIPWFCKHIRSQCSWAIINNGWNLSVYLFYDFSQWQCWKHRKTVTKGERTSHYRRWSWWIFGRYSTTAGWSTWSSWTSSRWVMKAQQNISYNLRWQWTHNFYLIQQKYDIWHHKIGIKLYFLVLRLIWALLYR